MGNAAEPNRNPTMTTTTTTTPMMLCCIPYPPVCVYHPVIKKDNKTKQKKKPFKNISQEEEKKFKKVNKGKKKETKQTTATKKSIKSNKIIYIYIKCFVHRFSLQFSLRLNRTFFQTNTLLKKTNFISPFYSIGPLFLFVYVLFLSTATTHTKKSEKKSCFFFSLPCFVG